MQPNYHYCWRTKKFYGISYLRIKSFCISQCFHSKWWLRICKRLVKTPGYFFLSRLTSELIYEPVSNKLLYLVFWWANNFIAVKDVFTGMENTSRSISCRFYVNDNFLRRIELVHPDALASVQIMFINWDNCSFTFWIKYMFS